MKTKTRNRGLYQQVTSSPETDAEMLNLLRESNQAYIDRCAALAGEVLRRVGHDPTTLFDVVDFPNGAQRMRFTTIDRGSLSPEADQAIDLLWYVKGIRDHGGPEKLGQGLSFGIHLAQAFENLKTNIAFRPAVESRRLIKKNLDAGRPKGRKAIKADEILKAAKHHKPDRYRAGKIARELGYSTEYVRKTLKKK